MQFQIPQFIEAEDKIFGPFTLKQFIYILGAGGSAFLLYNTLPPFIAIFLIIPISGVALLLAFKEVNNRPFIKVLEAAFKYSYSAKLYLWRKTKKSPEKMEKISLMGSVAEETAIPTITGGKLDNLAWNIDVKKGDDSEGEEPIKTGLGLRV